MIGLICIGLLGLGGVLFAIQSNRAQEQAAAETAAIPPTPIPPTNTPTSTTTPTPTNTPEPTATSTPVVDGEAVAQQEVIEPEEDVVVVEIDGIDEGEQVVGTGEDVEAVAVTPTSTLVVAVVAPTDSTSAQLATPAAPAEIIPSSGGVRPPADSHFLLLIAGGLVVVLFVYGAVYRSR